MTIQLYTRYVGGSWDSGTIFEDREGTYASYFGVETGNGPQLLVTEVPEPATMALLGLGALVLRHKR